MNCEIVCVGTELLLGDTVNTNASWIAKELAHMGVNVHYHTVVGDNPERLKAALSNAFSRADAVITTGGLGPTKDDLTKETAVSLLGAKLVLHEPSYRHIEESILQSGRKMTESVKKQAYLPEGCTPLFNYNGTAPGFILTKNGKTLIMMPGPPREMKKMFETGVMPFLAGTEKKLFSKHVRITGIAESDAADLISDLMDGTFPTVAPYTKDTEMELRVTLPADSKEDADRLMQPAIDTIKERLGRYVYGIDVSSLEERIINLLKEKGLSLSVAESITGGLISKRITDIPGASEVFRLGAVTYETRMKSEILGIDPKTIEDNGVVSEKTAVEMAENVCRISGSDIGLGITGIAGPGGGTEETPVGTVYAAVCDGKNTVCEKFALGTKTRGRALVREFASTRALNMLRLVLEDYK